jgi:branched-subunit amino acid transport protein
MTDSTFCTVFGVSIYIILALLALWAILFTIRTLNNTLPDKWERIRKYVVIIILVLLIIDGIVLLAQQRRVKSEIIDKFQTAL